jgi:hypothetical protein
VHSARPAAEHRVLDDASQHQLVFVVASASRATRREKRLKVLDAVAARLARHFAAGAIFKCRLCRRQAFGAPRLATLRARAELVGAVLVPRFGLHSEKKKKEKKKAKNSKSPRRRFFSLTHAMAAKRLE